MNSITAIIVDDEPNARVVLQRLLSIGNQSIQVVAECSNVLEAVKEINVHKPDVVFLDVQMPQYAGYEIVNFFDEIDFDIIFVTAFDDYAIKAFELNAMDYLVKPVERIRLANTLRKLEERLEFKRTRVEYQDLLHSLKDKKINKIIIPEIGNRRVVEVENIVAIEADGAYSIFHMLNEATFVVSKTLKYFEDHLSTDRRFFRSHRAYFINLSFVSFFDKKNYTISLSKDIKVRIARSRIEDFERIIR